MNIKKHSFILIELRKSIICWKFSTHERSVYASVDLCNRLLVKRNHKSTFSWTRSKFFPNFLLNRPAFNSIFDLLGLFRRNRMLEKLHYSNRRKQLRWTIKNKCLNLNLCKKCNLKLISTNIKEIQLLFSKTETKSNLFVICFFLFPLFLF